MKVYITNVFLGRLRWQIHFRGQHININLISNAAQYFLLRGGNANAE
jgi:hypothetical protein